MALIPAAVNTLWSRDISANTPTNSESRVSMTEDTRTTRLLVLLAANGLVMSKTFDFYIDLFKSHGLVQNKLAAILGAITLLGVAAAYGGLLPLPRWVKLGLLPEMPEIISAGMFFISIWFWIVLAYK
jgi:hypothetical protein